MNSPIKSYLLTTVFILNVVLFTMGGYYLVIIKHITLGQYYLFFSVGILNVVRVIRFNNKSAIKNLDMLILLLNIPIPFIHIGHIQIVIILISVVGIVIRWNTPTYRGKS